MTPGSPTGKVVAEDLLQRVAEAGRTEARRRADDRARRACDVVAEVQIELRQHLVARVLIGDAARVGGELVFLHLGT